MFVILLLQKMWAKIIIKSFQTLWKRPKMIEKQRQHLVKKVYSQAVQCENTVARTRAKPSRPLQLRLGSALLNRAKTSRRHELKIFYQHSVETDIKNGFVKCKTPRQIPIDKEIWERILVLAPLSRKQEQAEQTATCLQCCIKVQKKYVHATRYWGIDRSRRMSFQILNRQWNLNCWLQSFEILIT